MYSGKRFHLIIALALATLASLASFSALFRSFDTALYDSAHLFYRFTPRDDILIVNIDEQSLNSLGAWPWSRQQHADVIKELTRLGAKRIAFDVIFSEENKSDQSGDLAFAEAIRGHSHIVLPIFIGQSRSDGPVFEVSPAPIFYDANPKVGHVHINCDKDGICRSVYLKEGVGKAYWPHLSVALSDESSDSSLPGLRSPQYEQPSSQLIYRDFHNHILFPSNTAQFKTVSYVDVVNGYFPEQHFRNYTVFIGSTAAGLGDEISTPAGQIPGVVANAIIYQQLQEGSLVQLLPSPVVAIVIGLISFIVLAGLARLSPIRFLVATIGSLICAFLFMVLMLIVFRIWIPIAAFLAVLIAYYPLWNWFKLQLALNFLQRQLNEMDHVQGIEGRLLKHSSIRSSHSDTTYGVEIVTRTLKRLNQVSQTVQEQRFLIDNTLTKLQEAVILADADGNVLLSNDSANLLFASHHLENVFEFDEVIVVVENQSWSDWKSYVNAVANTGVLGLELKVPMKQGLDRTVYCRATRTNFEAINQAKSSVLMLSFTDISPLKEMERSRLDTLNFLSHDLRSPMVSILALIANIKSGRNNDPLEDNLQKIKKYAESNLNYSESILQLSRVEAANPDQFGLLDLHSIIDAAYLSVNDFAKSRQLELIVERTDEDFWVMGDADLLERSVQNLVSNAIKHSKSKNKIILRLFSLDNNALIQVEDFGEGIEPAELDKIFQRYKKVKGKGGGTGAGLGLYFVKTVMEKHQGAASVASDFGKGTCFTLSIPKISDI